MKWFFRHQVNKLIWLTLPSVYIETIFHIFWVDHFLCSAVTGGKKNQADESFKARENIPKVILTHSKSCSAGGDSVNDKGMHRGKQGCQVNSWYLKKASLLFLLVPLHGGWGRLCWSGHVPARRMFLTGCWSEIPGLWDPKAKLERASTLPFTGGKPFRLDSVGIPHQGKLSRMGLFQSYSHIRCCH